MLHFHIVTGSGAVDYFDGHFWTHQNGKLQFFDKNYAMSGWHGMAEFAVEYYDGVGYDGEPLKVVDGWETAQSSDPDAPAVLLTLTPVGNNSEEPTSEDDVAEWKFWAYANFSHELKASWRIPNPSCGWWRPENHTKSLEVIAVVDDWDVEEGTAGADYGIIRPNAGIDAIVLTYDAHGYSLEALVEDLAVIYYYYNKNPMGVDIEIEDLAICNHGTVGDFSVFSTCVFATQPFVTEEFVVEQFRTDSLNLVPMRRGLTACNIVGYTETYSPLHRSMR